jgi:hypothetical protein
MGDSSNSPSMGADTSPSRVVVVVVDDGLMVA